MLLHVIAINDDRSFDKVLLRVLYERVFYRLFTCRVIADEMYLAAPNIDENTDDDMSSRLHKNNPIG